MKFNRIRRILIILCSTILFFCGGIAVVIGVTPVFAEGENYLEVVADDFTLKYDSKNQSTYNFIMTYRGGKLPQDRFYLYTISDCLIKENTTSQFVKLQSVKANGNASEIKLSFDISAGAEYIAFTDAITGFTIPKNFTLKSSDKYNANGGYNGVIFVEDVTFEKDSNGVWTSKTSLPPTDEPEESEKEKISLEGASFAPVWNSIQKTLYIDIETPFTVSADVIYTATAVGIRVDGAQYNGEITFTQAKEQNILRCTLYDAEALALGSGITITLFDTDLDSETTDKISLTGSCSYYGYLDGVWLKDELFEVIKRVGDTITSERFAITQTQYVLPDFEKANGQMALGWLYNDELYKIGENITTNRNNRVILLDAITIGYTLVGGASIRYGQENDSGIRFTAKLQEEEYEPAQPFIKGLGVILLPSDKLRDGVGFTYENYKGEYNGNAQQAYILKSNIDFNGTSIFKFYATVVRIKAQNYNRSYSARGYVNVSYKSGVTHVYTDNIEKRSVYQVASNILQANPPVNLETWQRNILEGYVNGVANISYDELTGTAQNICASSNPIIKEVQVRIDTNGTINLVLKTTMKSFSAVTFNGKRVVSSLQNYDSENGILTVKFTADNLTK